jgi:hypothetical protein
MRDAYYNLNKGKPQDKDKTMGYSDTSTKEKSKENLTDKDKTNLKGVDFKEKNISDNNSRKKK